MKRILSLAAIALVVVFFSSQPHAQLRLLPVSEARGDVKLQLLLRKLHTVGTFMMTTAHPDDENNGLLAEMTHGAGLRTVLVSATRGDGGQNEIGPEIFDALAVLRTEELLAVHRFDGPEQFFTRAVDFGYSFSIDETYEKWGKDEIIGDYVRHIRVLRPDLIVGFLWEGTSGGLHHQASTHLTAEAFRAAADPAKYPEQIKEGLRPWQAKKFYYTAGFGGGGRGGGAADPSVVTVNSSVYDPVLGRTYDEIGADARTMHKCQSVTQLGQLPGADGGGRTYKLQDSVIPGQLQAKETSLLDGLDLTWASLVSFAGSSAPSTLAPALAGIARSVDEAGAAFKARGAEATVAPLASGLHQLRALRASISGLGADAKFEIEFRIAQKERQFEDALLTASAVRIEAIGDDTVVTPGQTVGLQLIAGNQGRAAVTVTKMAASGFTAPAVCQGGELRPGGAETCRVDAVIPLDAKSTDVYFAHHDPRFARYLFDPSVPFGAPFAPTPYRAAMQFTIASEAIDVDLPIEARYGADVFAGEKRTELLVAPALTLIVSPEVMVMPTGASAKRDVRVTVRNNSNGAAAGTVQLKVPAGWTVTPASAPVTIGRADEEATVRFTVTAPAGTRPGALTISAEVTSGSATFNTGYQVVEYPHIRKRLLFHPAEAAVKLIDVKVAPNLKVGYIMGAGDKVPDAIAQLDVSVSFIDSDELAWGDLSKYNVIMLGVRAYDKRADLRANNQRLLEYVKHGGVALLNYARTEFNPPLAPQGGYGPYPAVSTSDRVTDENAPMTILVPDHRVFNAPNKIGPDVWANWVQERGTYFLGQRGPEYVDLLESQDPFPNNPGAKRGILVEAKYGQGEWVYIGLVLWRELPAGVVGSYQILANLLSLGAK